MAIVLRRYFAKSSVRQSIPHWIKEPVQPQGYIYSNAIRHLERRVKQMKQKRLGDEMGLPHEPDRLHRMEMKVHHR